MARLIDNPLLNKPRGKIGNLVFRKYGDRTIICMAPGARKKPPTAMQASQMQLFKEAVAYARALCNDPDKVSEIEKKLKPGQSVWHFAVAEYFKQSKSSSLP